MLKAHAPAKKSVLYIGATILGLNALSPRTVFAQATAPSAIVPHALVMRLSAPHVTLMTDQAAGRGRRVAKGAGIGFLVGAVGGAIAALVVESTNSGRRPDIREDERGYAYVVMIPVGAAAGTIIGAIVGASRR